MTSRRDALMMEQFRSGMHTVKNMLSSVMGFTDTLVHRPMTPEQLQAYVHPHRMQLLHEQLQHIHDMTEALLNGTASEASGEQLQAPLVQVLEESWALFRLRKTVQGLVLQSDWSALEGMELRVSRSALQMVLGNVLINASDEVVAWLAQAVAQGLDAQTLLAGPHIVCQAQVLPGVVRVRVCNQGRTIDPLRKTQIFERGVTDKPHGNGLGLADSLQQLQAMGGRLWVEDWHEPSGSCFILEWPIDCHTDYQHQEE